EAKLQKKGGADTHKTSTPSPIFSPNNPYIQDSSTNTEGEVQTEVAAEESDKPTPTTSEMEILTDSKEPSSTQSTLQEIPFTVVSYKKSNNKIEKEKKRERILHIWINRIESTGLSHGAYWAKEPTLRLLPL
ncbi:17187_t:CDS:2, partial [Gigaspora rosea]